MRNSHSNLLTRWEISLFSHLPQTNFSGASRFFPYDRFHEDDGTIRYPCYLRVFLLSQVSEIRILATDGYYPPFFFLFPFKRIGDNRRTIIGSMQSHSSIRSSSLSPLLLRRSVPFSSFLSRRKATSTCYVRAPVGAHPQGFIRRRSRGCNRCSLSWDTRSYVTISLSFPSPVPFSYDVLTSWKRRAATLFAP